MRALLQIFVLFFSFTLLARDYVPGEYYEEGELVKVDVRKLHPTQFAVGYEEVKARKEEIKEALSIKDKSDKKAELKDMAGEAVIGPNGDLYLVDGHHHSRAFYELGHYEIYIKIQKDWSNKSPREFWSDMKNLNGEHKRTRVYLKDPNGVLRSEKQLPKTVAGLKDNPYRSLVFLLIEAGILEKKDGFPMYGEFKVADWLRPRVAIATASGRKRFQKALEEAAILLTRKENQKYELPGQIRLKKWECYSLISAIW